MTVVWLARIALATYLIYSVAFAAEGLESRGPVSLKILNVAAELLIVATLVWVGFFL